MKHGFIKVAAVTPKIRVADPVYNADVICSCIDEAVKAGAKVIVFPELCLTGYTCGDLFLQNLLLDKAKAELVRIAEYTQDKDALIFVGLPFEKEHRLYNVAAAIQDGKVLALIPKAAIPTYGEFYEGRYFTAGNQAAQQVWLDGKAVDFGINILFTAAGMDNLKVACEICEDLWTAAPPATQHALAGATLLVNLSASNETVGKDVYRELLVKSSSARLLCAYIYTSAGEGESTQDTVFGGHNIIAENGTVLAQAKRFTNQILYADIDVGRLDMERRRMGTYQVQKEVPYRIIPFLQKQTETKLERTFDSLPFVPNNPEVKNRRCEEILNIQAYGLKKRMEHTGLETAVIGLSGGLDSTLALLVTAKAFDLLEKDRRKIVCVTMPCFGTTDRTYQNACKLARTLGTDLREIDIRKAVNLHFQDIGQDSNRHDAAYENAQARERTQVLMDLANRLNGLVIGTGDMSELALGWATYNGDHMSMYGVNAGVPKTLVRHLVRYYADICKSRELETILTDVLDTPVSPELLPPVDGAISQKTEDLVGPYELHDFFLYYMLRCGFEPSKVFRVARLAFAGQYADAVILKWMKTFYRRFFSQQFKRSCLPDGPKVGSVALSPRGDLRMPSDACMRLWMEETENL